LNSLSLEMMKIKNISDLESIAIQLENLADDLDKAIKDDPELLIKVNAGRESLRNLERYGLITKERRPGQSSAYRINEQAYERQEREGRDAEEDEANG